jgi:hypothetical protein
MRLYGQGAITTLLKKYKVFSLRALITFADITLPTISITSDIISSSQNSIQYMNATQIL